MAMIQPCSVPNFKMIELQKWRLCFNEVSRYFSLRCGSDPRYPIMQKPPGSGRGSSHRRMTLTEERIALGLSEGILTVVY